MDQLHSFVWPVTSPYPPQEYHKAGKRRVCRALTISRSLGNLSVGNCQTRILVASYLHSRYHSLGLRLERMECYVSVGYWYGVDRGAYMIDRLRPKINRWLTQPDIQTAMIG